MAIEQDAMTAEEIIEQHFSTVDPLFKEEQVSKEETEVEAYEEETEDAIEEEVSEEEASDDEEEVVAKDEEVEEESDTPWMPESLDDLAAAMEVDSDDLKGSIRVKTKVDGVEGEATLAEVIKNYQLNKSLTERSEAFSHKQKQFEEAQAKFQQDYEVKISEAEALVEVMEDNLKADLVNIDWDTLEREDPGRYAATRQKAMEKIGMLEQAKQNVLEKREESRQKAMEEYSKRHAEILEYNRQELLKAIPEFSDQSKMKEGVTKIKDYLKSAVGVSDQELETITDYRMVVLAQKAMAYDEMQTKVKPAKAKAKTKPKFTKPGAAGNKAKQTEDAAKRKYKRAAASQDVDAWASVLEDRIF